MLSEKVVHYNYAKQKHAPRPVRVSEENVKTSVKLGKKLFQILVPLAGGVPC